MQENQKPCMGNEKSLKFFLHYHPSGMSLVAPMCGADLQRFYNGFATDLLPTSIT